MKAAILFIIIFFSLHGNSQDSIYYAKTFGHIHLKPYSNSSSVTGVSCGEKLKKDTKIKVMEQDWEGVEFGAKKGFVYKNHTSFQTPKCLQADYPIFFQSLELDLTEIFLWGRLSDQFIEFETGR